MGHVALRAARFRCATSESPVSLGEGLTPMHDAPALAREIGVARLWVKDEGLNPTASFKARGMSAAVTRARALGVPGFVTPTAGNAGAALAAYGAAARLPVRIYAPETTPQPILDTIRALGAELHARGRAHWRRGKAGARVRGGERLLRRLDAARAVSHRRKEDDGLRARRAAGMAAARRTSSIPPAVALGSSGCGRRSPRCAMRAGFRATSRCRSMVVAQAEGCAPIVRAFSRARTSATPWENPSTHASGLRVPGPLGDRLILRALRESRGDAQAVSEDAIRAATLTSSRATGVDAAPEGGCALAVAAELVRARDDCRATRRWWCSTRGAARRTG